MRGFQPPPPANVPAEYKNRIGRITAEKTIPNIRQFVEAGGTILALDTATVLAYHLGLPLANALVEKTPDGTDKPLGPEKFYIPGSLLRARVDNTDPLAHGMPDTVDVFFDNTPAFTLLPDAELKGVRPVAWFDDGKLLRSGWAWGESYLHGGASRSPRRRWGRGRSSSTGRRSPSAASRTARSSCCSTASTTAPPRPSQSPNRT